MIIKLVNIYICKVVKLTENTNKSINEKHVDMELILVDDNNWDADNMEHPDNYDNYK